MLDNCVSDGAAERRRGRLSRAGDRLAMVLLRSVQRIDRLSIGMENDVSLEGEDRVLKSLGAALKILDQLTNLPGSAGAAAPQTGAARESLDDETRQRLAERIATLATAFETGVGDRAPAARGG